MILFRTGQDTPRTPTFSQTDRPCVPTHETPCRMPAYVIDLAFVERMLEMAERRIAEPTSSEALYREIADELERTEGDPKMARILLVTFTNSYAAHLTSGDRLRKLRIEAEWGSFLRRRWL